MSSKSHHVLILFIALCMYGYTIPSWSNLQMIQLGFFICAFIVNFGIQLVITPMKHEAVDEELELEAEVRLISCNDGDGWSKKLRDKKRQKIIALTEKIGMLETFYMVANFLTLFLCCGGSYCTLQIARTQLHH
ncbi:uncharacterized protein LOC113352957 isoform X1 [Papaver somniferum]|uniref:uncharacterized protein LOC113352957 isoform X1 n=1 Tax=Papaver somniferum TaxID=3469 RepID=UPI000E6F7F26|nr:uncharacterized protein LOC113352957 isoform X1 [Papaver somniferum]